MNFKTFKPNRSDLFSIFWIFIMILGTIQIILSVSSNPAAQLTTATVSIPSNVFCDKDGLFYIKNGNITSPVWNTNAKRQYICVDTDTHIIVK